MSGLNDLYHMALNTGINHLGENRFMMPKALETMRHYDNVTIGVSCKSGGPPLNEDAVDRICVYFQTK